MRHGAPAGIAIAAAIVGLSAHPASSAATVPSPSRHSSASSTASAADAQRALEGVVQALKSKWQRQPRILAALESSQNAWKSATELTCGKLVGGVYEGGSLAGKISDSCETQAATQRADLLRRTFRSTLRN